MDTDGAGGLAPEARDPSSVAVSLRRVEENEEGDLRPAQREGRPGRFNHKELKELKEPTAPPRTRRFLRESDLTFKGGQFPNRGRFSER